MKKTITIHETLRYARDMVVEVPDEEDDEYLDSVLEEAMDEANDDESLDSMFFVLKNYGINILSYPDESFDSPLSAEYEAY